MHVQRSFPTSVQFFSSWVWPILLCTPYFPLLHLIQSHLRLFLLQLLSFKINSLSHLSLKAIYSLSRHFDRNLSFITYFPPFLLLLLPHLHLLFSFSISTSLLISCYLFSTPKSFNIPSTSLSILLLPNPPSRFYIFISAHILLFVLYFLLYSYSDTQLSVYLSQQFSYFPNFLPKSLLHLLSSSIYPASNYT